MSAQGLQVIDHTVHLTYEWLAELTDRLGWRSKRSALRLLRIVLHMLRDRLAVDELAQFSAQLPLLLRGMMFEGWVPKNTPSKERHAEAIAAEIAQAMGEVAEYRGLEDISSVFALFNNRLSRGEIEDVRATLPRHLRELWPAPRVE